MTPANLQLPIQANPRQAVVVSHIDPVTGSNIHVLETHAKPLQPAVATSQSPAPLPFAPAPSSALEVPVHADIDKVPFAPALSSPLEVPVMSNDDW